MIDDAYILYIDDSRSISYKNHCLESISKHTELNAIPVMGYNGCDPYQLSDDIGFRIIPFYIKQIESGHKPITGAISCSAGHLKIWQMIVETGRPSAIFEHDVVVKSDFRHLEVKDGEILWLGPRIALDDDYAFPDGHQIDYIDIDRFEGTHAYAVTPKTAQYLIDMFMKYGFNDSLDGQLGMRNMFDLNMRTLDPPPVVAVVGGRSSCIEESGNPGFWNAVNTPKFLSSLRQGCTIPPERKLIFSNSKFIQHTPILKRILDDEGMTDGSEKAVLVIGGYEGMSAKWLSNQLLSHDDSQLHTIGLFTDNSELKSGLWNTPLEKLYMYNTYFSKYYFKMNVVPADSNNLILAEATSDPDIKFDVIYADGNHEFKDVLYDGIVGFNLLKDNGLIIFDDADNFLVKKAIDVVTKTVPLTSLFEGDICVYKKGII